MINKSFVVGMVVFLAGLVLAACAPAATPVPSTTPPPVQETEPAALETRPSAPVEKTLYVGPTLVDCKGVAPQKCLQVKENLEDDYTLFYGQIEGFNYEEGNEYVLTVREEQVENPPADASSIKWSLVEVVSQTSAIPAITNTELEGKLWSLDWLLDPAVGQINLLSGTQITVQFQGGKLNGIAGCNNYFASYELDGDQIQIGPVGSTQMACPQPIMNQEAAYLAVLGNAASFSAKGDQLEIADAQGNSILSYTEVKPLPLTGTLWQLLSYNNGKGGVVSVLTGTELTAVFGDDGNLSGSAGCNNYNASYQVDGDKIQISPAASTMMACDQPEGVMLQESEYLAALDSAATYQVQGVQLLLSAEDGATVAIYKAAVPKPLVGTLWELVGYNNGKEAFVSGLAGTNVSALFGEDGRLSGSAGCNTYTATYQVDGQAIQIGPVATTRMMCNEPEGIMQQEIEYLQALERATDYQIQGNFLVMTDADGTKALEYKANQLVGSLWQLIDIQYSNDTQKAPADPQAYTVQFMPDGTLAIKADCNSAYGNYTLNGSELKIELGATTKVACSEGSLSAEYLENLQIAASYLLQGETLNIAMQMDVGIMRFIRIPES